MSEADGKVLDAKKFVNNGPNGERWNIVLLGDGFNQFQQGSFQSAAVDFVNALQATPPFDEPAVWARLNVHRIRVESTESGADNPLTCGDGSSPIGGVATTAATYFDASFCNSGVRRRLQIDQGLALTTAIRMIPDASNRLVVVIVNHPEHGGSGGQAACFSLSADALPAAIHELGHTAFGLADEYEYEQGCDKHETGHDTYTGPEPTEPNVTRNGSDRATLKWRHLVDKTTRIPTTRNGDCSQCRTDPNPVSDSTVGAFVGAKYFHCGLYRPVFNCKMRTLTQPFCPVCKDAIRRKLAVTTPPPSSCPPAFAFAGSSRPNVAETLRQRDRRGGG